ncbi:hypothetical protein BC939DRAFT_441441 [Gamsiella multidivaricata]|uniref:uncharacterized protein n=1 Tax=Gamsiella multidivaricata TaxID=101098 RepID=UPI00221F76DC|nr:uncharacterized protein BC939DRAFT_441441 [Gamsiella multidivaricata]KAI7829672.1 hypothetical protein BC939DRAFT_441441 [Gamsiella multidivaricata]
MTQRVADIRLHLKISRQTSRYRPTIFFLTVVDGCPDPSLVFKKKSEQQISFDTPLLIVLRVSYRLCTAREDSTSIGNAMRLKLDHVSSSTRSPTYSSKNTKSTNNPSSTISTSTSTEAGPSTSTNVGATNPPPKKKKKSTPKKDQLAADEMTKIQLIRAMQTEHPLRTLDIGILKANTSRAIKKEVPYDEDLQDKLRHAVTTCLSDISNLASKSKRACQQVIGQYLESLSVDHLDEDDRTILSYLTPHFSVQEIAAAKKGTTPNPEDKSSDDEDGSEASNENKNSPVEFFLSLLVTVYKASTPQEKKKASAGAAACLFLRKAKDYLPPKTGSGRFVSCNCGSNVTY